MFYLQDSIARNEGACYADMEAGERQTWVANMQSANEAISGLYSGETCGPVVRALVFKYVAWTEEELEEWEVGCTPNHGIQTRT